MSSTIAPRPTSRTSSTKSSIPGTPTSSTTSRSSSKDTSSESRLPNGVRHRPPEMRKSIRRKQNNDSAKRGREKKRMETNEIRTAVRDNNHRIKKLENQVEDLEATLRAKRKARKSKTDTNNPGEFFQREKFFGDPF